MFVMKTIDRLSEKLVSYLTLKQQRSIYMYKFSALKGPNGCFQRSEGVGEAYVAPSSAVYAATITGCSFNDSFQFA